MTPPRECNCDHGLVWDPRVDGNVVPCPKCSAPPKLGGWCETHGGYTGERCGGHQYDGRGCAGDKQ